MPVAVKDLCYSKSVRTMGGSAVLRSFVPDVDATVVTRLRDAGAEVLGKLNLTEGAMGGYHPTFDIPVNPWGADRWSGVSSSGSGVAVAGGLCFAAIGTDTGGSIRYPASANGVVGLKPTYGRVSRFGVLPLAESLDHVGPMARRVADVAILFDAIAGFDPRDPTSLREPAPSAQDGLTRGVAGLRIGIDREVRVHGRRPRRGRLDRRRVAGADQPGRARRGRPHARPHRHHRRLVPTGECRSTQAHAAHYPSRASEYGPSSVTSSTRPRRSPPHRLPRRGAVALR